MSSENIYKAIYCLKSYVFDKDLLNKEDLKLFYELSDKYNTRCVEYTIRRVQSRLSEIVFDDKTLFHVNVFFKIKDYNEETKKIVYRPMHTAPLCDLIAMASLLIPLLFDDSDGHRRKSELTKLIPHNFYGNIPGSKVEFLFEPWSKKYAEYTTQIVEHCREYQKSLQYRTELSLDIKNFFPSIRPLYIYNTIFSALSPLYEDPQDKETLCRILTKLLYFTIDKENIEGWKDEYYKENAQNIVSDTLFLTLGIPQGLPQSYLFGNLCMIDVAKAMESQSWFKECDAYYYVDDSVIYIGQKIESPDFFKDMISRVNEKLIEIGKDAAEKQKEFKDYSPYNFLEEEYIAFHRKLDYVIKLHCDGKNCYTPMEKAVPELSGYQRETYKIANAIYDNYDEEEDLFFSEKAKILTESLKQKYKANIKSEKEIETEQKKVTRLIKFFSLRMQLLSMRQNASYLGMRHAAFNDDLKVSPDFNCEIDRKKWIEKANVNIFHNEGNLLIASLSIKKAKELVSSIASFERRFAKREDEPDTCKWLYYSKAFDAELECKTLSLKYYESLETWVRSNFGNQFKLGSTELMESLYLLVDFLVKLRNGKVVNSLTEKEKELSECLKQILPDYAYFIFVNSNEFCRTILNAYFSVCVDVQPSNATTFAKKTERKFCYAEFRTLAWLRNRDFTLTEFHKYLNSLNCSSLENKMAIDINLVNVLGTFIGRVKRPQWVDDLIVTHRIVKGLWQNGSKFLNQYTLHNEEHAITLIELTVRIARAIDYISIKRVDYYILFLACYLHDISMVIHPNLRKFCSGDNESLSIVTDYMYETNKNNYCTVDVGSKSVAQQKEVSNFLIDLFERIFSYFENDVRSNHAQDSAKLIREWNDTFLHYLAPTLIAKVADVAESHGFDVDEVYWRKSKAKKSLISEKYMMILIRLADLLDVANDRVNYYLLKGNIEHMEKTSQFHWISHLVTDKIVVRPEYRTVDKDGQNSPFIEYLNFNMYVNVKYESQINRCDTCKKGCFRVKTPEAIDTLGEEIGFKHSGIYTLDFEKENVETPLRCPLLCKWIATKHNWLLEELQALQAYLNEVNNNMFKTKIRLNIFYNNDYELEPKMFDSVRSYLSKS